MEYDRLIREAWSITWRHRFLWVLGLFASSSVGSCASRGGAPIQWQGNRADWQRLPAAMATMPGEVARWFEHNVWLIVLAAAIAVLIALAFLIVSFIAQGAMARATTDLARGHETNLGAAWRTGVHLFWRYVGLAVFLVLAVVVAAGVIGAAVVPVIVARRVGGSAPNLVALPLLVLIGLTVIVGAVVVAILASILIAYAQRAIAVEDAGPLAALGDGWRLLWGHLGTSLLVWLLNVVLSIAAGIAAAVVVVVAVAVLAIVGALLWLIAGLTTPTYIYIALGVIVVLAGAWVLGGITNTFFWNYWTLAYLRLRHPEQTAT